MVGWRRATLIPSFILFAAPGNSQITNRRERVPPNDPYEEAYSPYRARNDIYGSWPVTTRTYIPSSQLNGSPTSAAGANFDDTSNLIKRPFIWEPNTLVSVRDQPHKLVGVNPPFLSTALPQTSTPPPLPPMMLNGNNLGEVKLPMSSDSEMPPVRIDSQTAFDPPISRAMDTLTVDGGNLRPSHNHTDVAPPVDKSFLDFIADWEGKNEVENIGDVSPSLGDNEVELDMRDNMKDGDADTLPEQTGSPPLADSVLPTLPLTAMKNMNSDVPSNDDEPALEEEAASAEPPPIKLDNHEQENGSVPDDDKENHDAMGEEEVRNSGFNEAEELTTEPHEAESELFFSTRPESEDVVSTVGSEDRRMRYALPCCSARFGEVK